MVKTVLPIGSVGSILLRELRFHMRPESKNETDQ